ncbi:unnamed protein product [Mytilus edulis]|uniref:Uncharacterized protein n=1 Tax=Mytilus edulis TaxID=6550 RepID=A0A8S3TDM2_MYTED|nr:unnamed protein product [Mytilus edulis]
MIVGKQFNRCVRALTLAYGALMAPLFDLKAFFDWCKVENGMQASKDVQDFLLKSRERGNQMVKSAVEGCVNESEPRVFYSPISKSPLNTFNDMTKTSKLKCTSGDFVKAHVNSEYYFVEL